MVVGMDRLLLAPMAAKRLGRHVGDDLVGVHVRLRAGTGLPHHQRELVVEFAPGNPASSLCNGFGEFVVQQAERIVGPRRRPLDRAEGMDDLDRNALSADAEVLAAPLRLRAPKPVGRYGNGAD